MKSLILIFILLPIFLLSQKINTTENKTKSNIYNDAIKRYLAASYASNSYDRNRKMDTLFVEKSDSFDDSILTKINGTIIKIMDGADIKSKLDLVESYTLHRFFSLKFDKELFNISVIPFYTTKDQKGINLSNGGGCEIFYTFDNASQQFHFKKISCRGI